MPMACVASLRTTPKTSTIHQKVGKLLAAFFSWFCLALGVAWQAVSPRHPCLPSPCLLLCCLVCNFLWLCVGPTTLIVLITEDSMPYLHSHQQPSTIFTATNSQAHPHKNDNTNATTTTTRQWQSSNYVAASLASVVTVGIIHCGRPGWVEAVTYSSD